MSVWSYGYLPPPGRVKPRSKVIDSDYIRKNVNSNQDCSIHVYAVISANHRSRLRGWLTGASLTQVGQFMKYPASPLYVIAALTAIPGLGGSAAHADIAGFGDFSGYRINQNDSATPPALFPAQDRIQLTVLGQAQRRSIFANATQNITQFIASFRYQALNAGNAAGASFVIQNDPRGAAAVNPGPGFGGFGFGGIAVSAGITLELGTTTGFSGLYTNGNVGGGSFNTSPVNLASGHFIDVSLVYNGSTLREIVTDVTTGGMFDRTYALNPAGHCGGDYGVRWLCSGLFQQRECRPIHLQFPLQHSSSGHTTCS